MTIKKLAAAAALLAAIPAFATITGGGPSNTTLGEMFLSVYDEAANRSYTVDLGAGFTNQASFKSLADGNQAGYSMTWSFAGDSAWASYFAATNGVANDKWLVMSVEKSTLAQNAPGGRRLLTTVRNGDEDTIPDNMRTQGFSAFIGSPQSGAFFSAVNQTGTHATSANGSSYNTQADGKALVGGTGSVITDNFNNQATFGNSNLVGQSAQFAYITNSATSALAPVAVDFFENTRGRGTFTFSVAANGNASLVYTLASAVPEPSTYALLIAGLMAVGFVARRRNQA